MQRGIAKGIKFGVIGTGRMAATMMGVFDAVPDVEVIAVSSASPDRARGFANRFRIPACYGSLDEFLRNDAIAAVYVANRNLDHCRTTIAALRAGKAVLCEKPFAINLKEGEAVVAAARATGKLFMEAMWTPFLPAYERLVGLVKSGTFGKPTHLHFDFGYPASEKTSPSLFVPGDGGVLLDRSAYGISLALRVLGDVKMVDASLGSNAAGVDVDASLQLTHRSGGQSQLGFSLTSLMSNSASVACEGGLVGLMPPTIGAETVFRQHVVADRSQGGESDRAGLKHRIVSELRRFTLVRRVKAAASRPKNEYHSFGTDPYLPQLRHFIELLHAGRVESGVNTWDSSLAVLRIIEAAKASRQFKSNDLV
jgi:predicted dehydrogenase